MLTINFHPFPVLTTERLLLRRIEQHDVPELFIMRSDERVMQYIDRPRATSHEDAAKHIHLLHDLEEKNEGIAWGIALLGENKITGTIGIWNIDNANYRAEIGYALVPDYFGKGIMNEAMTSVLKYGFEVLQLHSIEANVSPGNTASIKLLERHHFVQEGYFKENYFFNGQFKDSIVYSLITPVLH